jgi:hypothetical protein
MRKRLISPIPHERVPSDSGGLDLANLGMVEITRKRKPIPSNVRCNSEHRSGLISAMNC